MIFGPAALISFDAQNGQLVGAGVSRVVAVISDHVARQAHNLALGHFELCRHDRPFGRGYPRRAATHQLRGSQGRQNDELERVGFVRSVNHRQPPVR